MDKDIELQKIQTFDSNFQAWFNVIGSTITGMVIGLIITFITLFYEGVLNPVAYFTAIGLVYAALVYLLVSMRRRNNEHLEFMDSLYARVEKGEALPSLAELKKQSARKGNDTHALESEKTSNTRRWNLSRVQPIIALIAMICSISILIGSIVFVWSPSIKSPKLEVQWSSSYGNKVDDSLFLVNQSQVRQVNITLQIYNTGSASAHDVSVSFSSTTGIGSFDFLLISVANQMEITTYSNVYHQGLLKPGVSLSVIVVFEVSFYGIWNSASKPMLYFQTLSSELPTINVAIEIGLV